MKDDKYITDDVVIDDSNLAQCEWCDYVVDWDAVEYVNDPWSDGKVSKCPRCNEGESFKNTEKDRVV